MNRNNGRIVRISNTEHTPLGVKMRGPATGTHSFIIKYHKPTDPGKDRC